MESNARRRDGEQERRSHAWWLEPSARSRSQVQPRLMVVEEAEGPERAARLSWRERGEDDDAAIVVASIIATVLMSIIATVQATALSGSM